MRKPPKKRLSSPRRAEKMEAGGESKALIAVVFIGPTRRSWQNTPQRIQFYRRRPQCGMISSNKAVQRP